MISRQTASTRARLGRRAGWIALIVTAALAFAAQAQPLPSDAAQIRSLLEAKKFAEAETEIGRAIATQGETDALLALRAELYRRTDRMDQAYADYKRLVVNRPNDTEALFWIATIDRWRGRHDDAIAAYSRVIALSNCNQGALTGRARVYQSANNLAAAEADLRAALACNPGAAEASELLAAVLVRKGRDDEAISVLRDAFSGADLEQRLGDFEMSRKNTRGAREHYRAALAARPEDAKLIEKLADAERVLGNTAAALVLYEKASSLSEDGGPLYWIGILSLRTGQIDRAEKAFDAMLQRKPDDTGALIGKSRVRRAQSRPDEALELVDRALALRPDNGEARVLRGALLQSLGRKQEARREYEAALARNPADSDALLLLERIGPARSVNLAGRTSRLRAIEGLEDAGVLVDGVPIRPARIEYVNDSAEMIIAAETGARTSLEAELTRGRETVTNLDTDSAIYDFDVTTAQAGFDHRLSDRWNLSWRLGGTRYEPREETTIETSTKGRGSLLLSYDSGAGAVVIGYSRRPYIHRGFGADTKFRIFEEDRLSLSWERTMPQGWSLRMSSGASRYTDQTDEPVNAAMTLRWDRRGNMFFVRLGHDPFAARVLGPDLNLDFIDFDAVGAGGRFDLGAGFALGGDVSRGRYGKTHRDDVIGGSRVEGPLENNTET
ncbi:MAG TPA: tetratricopeptide repeat protein, partial [Thermoanaerobaculia bacterium]